MKESFWQPDRKLGDYEVLEEIGRGGMGVVYKAQHRLLHQTVALKVMPESYLGDRQAVLRFRQEMLSLGRLNHPNVIRALNAGEARGVLYLVTEFVDGVTFRELVARKGVLSVGAACELIRQAAEGLEYVDRLGLVHRDIKPANLMLARDGVVKILDLGLARLDVAAARELTRPGIAMGTADYMAPEQWMDSSTVDIRADIYGLGCTLYFLLTGHPPVAPESSSPHGDTTSSGAGPARVALSEYRPDCPPELARVLPHFLAEDADDRFASPAEVVAALQVFSHPDQLEPLLGDLSGEAGELQIADQESPQPRRARRGMARRGGRREASRSTRPRDLPTDPQGRARRRRWELSGLGTALVVVLAVGLSLYWAGNGQDTASSKSAAVVQAELVLEIEGLPGLNGLWWFDETPWLVPYVRQAMGVELRDAGSRSLRAVEILNGSLEILHADVTAVQDGLLRLAREAQRRLSVTEVGLLNELVRISSEDLRDEQLADRLRTAWNGFRANDAAGACPLHWHTRAVLKHKIAAISNDLELAVLAAEAYAQAQEGYGKLASRSVALEARCLVDSGQLYAVVLGDYPSARERFQAARSLRPAPRLLLIEAWVNEAIASSVANPQPAERYTDAGYALRRAREMLDVPELRQLNHPLAAHVHERHAWILMNQWNVRRASLEFQEARRIRHDNFWRFENDFAQLFVFHNDHGQAMAERYSGDVRLARAQYDLVLGEIQRARVRVERQPERRGSQRFLRELRERYSNSSERRADCELYQGAASGAPVDLAEAARLYAVARDHADDAATQAAMSCKRAISLALDGRLAEAESELARQTASGLALIGIHEERVRLLHKLAEAVLAAQNSTRESGWNALRSFLDLFDQHPDYPDPQRRETQEMQLLAAELLLAAQLRDPAPQSRVAAEQDAEYLDRLVAAFPYREQMLAYLRRYYDLLIEVRSPREPERAARHILASRNERPTPDATRVLFHFTDLQGRAILVPQEGAARHFPLEFGRQQLKAEKSPGAEYRTWNLPVALVEQLASERRAGRRVVISWDDQASWARTEAALTVEDWPFDHQWKLEPQESQDHARPARVNFSSASFLPID